MFFNQTKSDCQWSTGHLLWLVSFKSQYSQLCFILAHWSSPILSELSGEMGLSELFRYALLIVFVLFFAFLSK